VAAAHHCGRAHCCAAWACAWHAAPLAFTGMKTLHYALCDNICRTGLWTGWRLSATCFALTLPAAAAAYGILSRWKEIALAAGAWPSRTGLARRLLAAGCGRRGIRASARHSCLPDDISCLKLFSFRDSVTLQNAVAGGAACLSLLFCASAERRVRGVRAGADNVPAQSWIRLKRWILPFYLTTDTLLYFPEECVGAGFRGDGEGGADGGRCLPLTARARGRGGSGGRGRGGQHSSHGFRLCAAPAKGAPGCVSTRHVIWYAAIFAYKREKHRVCHRHSARALSNALSYVPHL